MDTFHVVGITATILGVLISEKYLYADIFWNLHLDYFQNFQYYKFYKLKRISSRHLS